MITDVKRERVAMTKEEAITIMQSYKEELEHRIAKIDYDLGTIDLYSIHLDAFEVAIEALSAEAVSRDEEYEEMDGVITIEKQSVKDVGEIKHIVIRSPNYTRYFYNESMPISAEAVHKPDYSYEADMVRRLKESLSAEAEPTVIRCKTLLNAEDFEAVATRIRKENRNVIVIPCETEVVSAEAVQGWIPCSERLPDVGEIVIASWSDLWSDAIVFARRYCEDDWEWAYEQGSDYWESARDYDRESNPEAWMPLPEPYEPKTERRG